jgi:hypothetical protein
MRPRQTSKLREVDPLIRLAENSCYITSTFLPINSHHQHRTEADIPIHIQIHSDTSHIPRELLQTQFENQLRQNLSMFQTTLKMEFTRRLYKYSRLFTKQWLHGFNLEVYLHSAFLNKNVQLSYSYTKNTGNPSADSRSLCLVYCQQFDFH